MKEIRDLDSEKYYSLFVLLGIVLLVWLSSIFLIPFVYPTLKNRAAFGDSFGAINSLFSGLAFAGIIYTIILQRKELKLQRDELSLTRVQLSKSADAQVESQKELAKQSLNMKRTAELNALSLLIEDLNNRITLGTKGNLPNDQMYEYRDTRAGYLDRVKNILNDKQS